MKPLPKKFQGAAVVLAAPGQGDLVPIVFGALCPDCAKRIYPPELLKAAEEVRDRLLS